MKQTNTESIVPRGTQNVYAKVLELVRLAKRAHRYSMIVDENAEAGAEAYDRGCRDAYMRAARELKEMLNDA